MFSDQVMDIYYSVCHWQQHTVFFRNLVLLILRFRLFTFVVEALPLISFPSFTHFFLGARFKTYISNIYRNKYNIYNKELTQITLFQVQLETSHADGFQFLKLPLLRLLRALGRGVKSLTYTAVLSPATTALMVSSSQVDRIRY